MKELGGRVAVVTGAASGIGLGMARAFASEGMKLVLADVEAEPLERAVKELAGEGADAIGEQCDVSKPESIEALRDRTLSQFGAVHVLCNNAGVGGSSAAALWEAPLDEWSWVMGVNLMGVVYGVRSFMPAMLEHGDPSHVVNTASMAGLVHGAGIYGVTKHAVVALSEALYSQLQAEQHPVGVSVLCPGWVRTRIMESERNRPEAPRPAPGERAAQFEMMRRMVEGFVQGGLEPLDVGRLVVESIRAPRFYVLTHPHWSNMIRNRMETILEGRDPVGIAPADEGQWSEELG
jgi:NAD(P)-dependent dehydrogenase (short-subunit alcohol dehydrogenase family)